jgi:hypothetical protein
MATEFCQKCRQAHPDRDCDYDDQVTAPKPSTSIRRGNRPAKQRETLQNSCRIAEEVCHSVDKVTATTENHVQSGSASRVPLDASGLR